MSSLGSILIYDVQELIDMIFKATGPFVKDLSDKPIVEKALKQKRLYILEEITNWINDGNIVSDDFLAKLENKMRGK